MHAPVEQVVYLIKGLIMLHYIRTRTSWKVQMSVEINVEERRGQGMLY